MTVQDPSDSVPGREGDDPKLWLENLEGALESNNSKLSALVDRMDIYIELRRSAWKERKNLEENFQLHVEAYKQRVEQLSRIMIPKRIRPKCIEHDSQFSESYGTGENRADCDRDYNDSTLPLVDYDSDSTLYLDIARCEPNHYGSSDTSSGNEGFRSASDGADGAAENRAGGDRDHNDSTLPLVEYDWDPSSFFDMGHDELDHSGSRDITPGNEGLRSASDGADGGPLKQPTVSEGVSDISVETPRIISAPDIEGLSDSELYKRLIEDLTEAHKRGIPVNGRKLWGEILGRVNRAQPSGEDPISFDSNGSNNSD